MKVIQKSEVEETKKSQIEAPFIPEVKVVDLPSKFLPYPKGCSISYKPYIYGELEEFNDSKFSVLEEVNFHLRGITTSFPAMDLAYFDYLAILLLRKISTFGGNQFSFPYKCPGCEKGGKHYSTLMDVAFEDLNVPNLPLIVTIGRQEMHFSPLTIGRYVEFVERKSEKPQGIQLLASEVINLKYEEAEKIIYNASGEDRGVTDHDVLDYLDEILFFGVKPIKFKCGNIIKEIENDNPTKEFMQKVLLDHGISPEGISLYSDADLKKVYEQKISIKCGTENSVRISPEVLTSPFRDDRESLRSRIRFGL